MASVVFKYLPYKRSCKILFVEKLHQQRTHWSELVPFKNYHRISQQNCSSLHARGFEDIEIDTPPTIGTGSDIKSIE
jgi:hypothetical protein